MTGERWDAVVVIGTKGPFPRLVEAVAAWARAGGRRVWMQHGESALPAGVEGAALVPRAELVARMAAADVVIVHAGTGAIRDALGAGHVPVVVARRAERGEHVNDHQSEIVEALGARIVACGAPEAAGAVEAAVAEARRRTAEAPGGATGGGAGLARAVAARLAAVAGPTWRTRWVWAALSLLTRSVRPSRRS